MTAPLSPEQLERLARKRAGAKLGWYVHAMVYVLVNLVLWAMSMHGFGSRPWSVFPLLGWGLGLALHGISVFMLGTGSDLRERLVQKERERLQRRSRTWICHTSDEVRDLPEEPFVSRRAGHDTIGVHEGEARLEAEVEAILPTADLASQTLIAHVHLPPAAAGTITTLADPMAINDGDFAIPPRGAYGRTVDCPIDADTTLLSMRGHTHDWGTRFRIELIPARTLGAMMGGGGAPFASQDLKSWLPEKLGGLNRENFEVQSGAAMGIAGSSAHATYAGGEQQIRLSITDIGGLPALVGL